MNGLVNFVVSNKDGLTLKEQVNSLKGFNCIMEVPKIIFSLSMFCARFLSHKWMQ